MNNRYRRIFQKKNCATTSLILFDDSDPILPKREIEERTGIKPSNFFSSIFSVKRNTNGKCHNG